MRDTAQTMEVGRDQPALVLNMQLSFFLRTMGAAACGIVLMLGSAAHAQGKIYRCGNEYTNDPGDAKAKGCRVIEGSNVTVIEGLKPPAKPKSGSATANGSARNSNEKVDSAEQRQRDADARAILTSELQKSQERLAALKAEYNNGEPDRLGNERNYQRYLDRVADLKAQIERTESDIAAIQRELSRLSGAAGNR